MTDIWLRRLTPNLRGSRPEDQLAAANFVTKNLVWTWTPFGDLRAVSAVDGSKMSEAPNTSKSHITNTK